MANPSDFENDLALAAAALEEEGGGYAKVVDAFKVEFGMPTLEASRYAKHCIFVLANTLKQLIAQTGFEESTLPKAVNKYC